MSSPISTREQPHIIADRIAQRIASNRLRKALGRPLLPVTTSPDFRRRIEGRAE